VTTTLVAISSWSEITHDFGVNWLIYLSMPFVAAFVGWSTKIVALEMLYRPIEFKGIGPIGWQGIVPRRAGKVGSKTIDLLTSNLLKPEELLARIDANEAVEALREPLPSTRSPESSPIRSDRACGMRYRRPGDGRSRRGCRPKRHASPRTCSPK
jgi:hypothetical protein